jgi:endonuclease/exonuclease/phosphatase (EEP) superfamily protein YafD
VAFLYFSLVFGTGFVLGPIRILWLVPRVGVRAAELLEIPIMVLVTILAARWVIRRYNVQSAYATRLGIGVMALSFMVVAEVGLALTLRGMSVSEYITNRDPISGTVYFLALALFASMPVLLLLSETDP